MSNINIGDSVVIHSVGSPLDGKVGVVKDKRPTARHKSNLDETTIYGVEEDGTILHWFAKELEVVNDKS